jgi:hypothetical protein
MWFAPGHVVIAGAMHISPAYDGAMLLANLTMIPSLVFFLIWIETRFLKTTCASTGILSVMRPRRRSPRTIARSCAI